MNNVININEGDLKLLVLCNINISLFKLLNNILLIKILIRLGEIQNKLGNSNIINKVEIQLISKFIIKVEGSKILNKFIIIFK